ncbi:coiled-coil domain-containing protein [Aquimarina mytili]|uniref:Uncharacterized protein n=1 Tax=Aquimarina mytili TaxID=874423 RepID=A0A937D7L0_9FLAO|nr:hypothetical protein [Aquimarina mytili]MBL0685644.1 hypothetical protein [Aquimarina mytili]
MKRHYITILLLIGICAEGKTTEPENAKSRLAIERQYNKLTQKHDKIEEEEKIFKGFLQIAQARSEKIKGVTFNKNQIKERLKTLKTNLIKIKSELETGKIKYASLEHLTTPYEDIINFIRKDIRRALYYNEYSYNGNSKSQFSEYIETLPLDKKFDTKPTVDFLPILNKYWGFRYRNKIIEMQGEEIIKLTSEIEALDISKIEALFDEYKTFQLEIVDFISEEVNEKIQSLKDDKKKIEKQIAEVDKSLGGQQEINNKLVYAVYLMIVALVVLFMGLYFFQIEIAGKIIEKRSLVEVISMAFMLITIIILGTGDRIGNETLGTLLGTIAGYIFGRGGILKPNVN